MTRRVRQALRRLAGRSDPLAVFTRLSDAEIRELSSAYDPTAPLPPDADAFLRQDNPRLSELRRTYETLDVPARVHSRWNDRKVDTFLDLRYFRGENPFVWHWRELPRATRLKFFIYLKYLLDRDDQQLLTRLSEDGAFGCWTYAFPDYPRVSRDLLDAVNELLFLNRQLHILGRAGLRVLDIGAGYGRLAHRMTQALPTLADYCCVDAVPESTFLCEYYLGYRSCSPKARVVSLDRVTEELQPGMFDLAINIHSFSECTYDAVAWWMDHVRRLQIPMLMITPNQPTELLTTEVNKSKRDFAPLLERAGYKLVVREPVFADAAVRELMRVDDHFHLYRLA